jgi:hypothetical protein
VASCNERRWRFHAAVSGIADAHLADIDAGNDDLSLSCGVN